MLRLPYWIRCEIGPGVMLRKYKDLKDKRVRVACRRTCQEKTLMEYGIQGIGPRAGTD